MEDQLLFMLVENLINEEEWLWLRRGNRNQRNLYLELPYWRYERFCLEEMTEEECEVELRFQKNDIYHLAHALNFPDVLDAITVWWWTQWKHSVSV